MNTNFPSNLDIKPSTAPRSTSALLSAGTEEIDPASVDDRFNVAAQEDAIRKYGIAGRVWEASYAMLAYLERDTDVSIEFDPPPFTAAHSTDARTVIELGSGTGLVAAHIAERLRPGTDRILATDLPEVCPLLEDNTGWYTTASVHALPWGCAAHAQRLAAALALPDSGAPTHIVCSDLVYFPALLAPLLRTLLLLTAPPFAARAQLVLSYKVRSLAKEQPFWAAFGLWFEFAPVLCRKQGPSGKGWGTWRRFMPLAGDDEAYIFVARRRPESAAWTVPEYGQELLAGVGAWGTPAGKADDTFETILLMGMDVEDVE